MSIATRPHIDHLNRLRVVFIDDNTSPERYTILFEDRERVVIAQPFESGAAVWQRVLRQLNEMRGTIWRGALHGRKHAMPFATIYAGITPTEEQKREHIREDVIFGLFQVANPALNKDANSQVKALILVTELLGLVQPPSRVVSARALETARAELVGRARRKQGHR